MGFFDRWKTSEDDNASELSAKEITDNESENIEKLAADPAVRQLLEKQRTELLKAAALKEHRQRAAVVNFISVVREDLESINENNFRPAVNMTIATLNNFIDVEKETNLKLLEEIK